jgi:ribonuclease BN (tRNA processing enzyme)
MIDCGSTAIEALDNASIKLSEIKNIAITHIHDDHMGGLEGVAFRTKYMTGKKIALYAPMSIIDPLWENSLKGGLRYTPEGFMELKDYFDIGKVEVVNLRRMNDEVANFRFHNWFTLGGQRFKFVKVNHIKNKRCYGIWCPGKFLYTSDTQFDPELLSIYGNNVKYIFHDCQFHKGGHAHANIDEILTLPDEIKQKLVLMHYGDEIKQYQSKIEGLTVAKQGSVFKID